MGDKISQYTADGTSNPLKDEDLFDASNEDGAGSFDLSKKITALELLAYINANVDNLYSTDGSIPNNREVVLNSKILSFIQGDIKLKSTGGNVNFVLESSVANKRVNLKHNDSLDTGEITLSNSAGDYFTASDGVAKLTGLLGINRPTPSHALDIIGDSLVRGRSQCGANNSLQGYDGFTVDNGASTSFSFLTCANNGDIHFRVGRAGQSGFGASTDSSSFMRVKSEGGSGTYRNAILAEQKIASTVSTKSIGMKLVNDAATISGFEDNVGIQIDVTGHADGSNNNVALEVLNGLIKVVGMPTSSAGLPSNTIWSDGGTLKIT